MQNFHVGIFIFHSSFIVDMTMGLDLIIYLNCIFDGRFLHSEGALMEHFYKVIALLNYSFLFYNHALYFFYFQNMNE